MSLNLNKKIILPIVFLVLGIALLLFLPFLLGLDFSFWSIFQSRDGIQKFIQSYGMYSNYAFIGIQALQVVIAPIPGEFTGAMAGYLFGGAKGALLATIGLSLGSLIAFSLGRVIGKPIINMMVSEKQLKKFSIASEQKKLIVIFVVFFIPGFPKDVLTYLFSMGRVGHFSFFLVSQAGRIPGTLLLTYGTEALFEKSWVTFGIAILIGATLIIIAALKREIIFKWLKE